MCKCFASRRQIRLRKAVLTALPLSQGETQMPCAYILHFLKGTTVCHGVRKASLQNVSK